MPANSLIPLIVALVMAAVVTVALGFPYLQAKLSILLAGGFVLFLSLVQLVRELRPKKPAMNEPGADHKDPEPGANAVQYLSEAAWVVGFALTIYLLGFVVAITLFTCAYMKSHGIRWRTSIITAALMSAFCYGIFSLLLEMNLYSGVIIMHLSQR